ncbi:putative sporulation protein YtaF [Oikeobacillus pervagus]|uniref:Sporulation protein YtaF n=1 Tax=Oikeobacillus pervagus TaxID=1325931 RepID=A0AAJ1WKT7_9BACI|nr:sporulation membrane protein YtaF [Oikeobacillus pervagus]MDQ0215476.1 putative sporulation protein YtaF [Oikeobacillus pervagus]
MNSIVSLLILAFAVSLDNFSTGLAYGMRKLKLPLKSTFILSCCSAGALLIAMWIGQLFGNIMSTEMGERLGGLILIGLGAWVLYQFFRDDKHDEDILQEKMILKLEIKSLGVVINILKKPTAADFDRSGTITGVEAVMLGIALSLDAFGAGVGAAFLGYSPGALSLAVAIMSMLFVTAGLKIGHIFSQTQWVQRMSFLPGLLLIILGILKI